MSDLESRYSVLKDLLSELGRIRGYSAQPHYSPATLLPPELLLLLFESGDKTKRFASLKAAATVCRTWNAPATAILYTHVAPKNAASLDLLLQTLQGNPLLASLVKSVDFLSVADAWAVRARHTSMGMSAWSDEDHSALETPEWTGKYIHNSGINRLLDSCGNIRELSYGLDFIHASESRDPPLEALNSMGQNAMRQLRYLRITGPCRKEFPDILSGELGPIQFLQELHLQYVSTFPSTFAAMISLRRLTLEHVRLDAGSNLLQGLSETIEELSLIYCSILPADNTRCHWPRCPRLTKLHLRDNPTFGRGAEILFALLHLVAPRIAELELVNHDLPRDVAAKFTALRTLELSPRFSNFSTVHLSLLTQSSALTDLRIDAPADEGLHRTLIGILPGLERVEHLTLKHFGPLSSLSAEPRPMSETLLVHIPPNLRSLRIECEATSTSFSSAWLVPLFSRDGGGSRFRKLNSLDIQLLVETDLKRWIPAWLSLTCQRRKIELVLRGVDDG